MSMPLRLAPIAFPDREVPFACSSEERLTLFFRDSSNTSAPCQSTPPDGCQRLVVASAHSHDYKSTSTAAQSPPPPQLIPDPMLRGRAQFASKLAAGRP
eukprot:362130-Chlamydomonas_euryale.AAC.1